MEAPAKGPNISASELGRLLDRISGSPGFRRSFRLQRFLRYVAEHAIDHPGRPLKEIQVAMAVFDKDASFDPRLDPIVRVEAGRLRLRLLEYYAEAGAEETILIEIPRGGYVPKFRVLTIARRPPSTYGADAPASHRLYLKGRYFWGKRTAADLAKAVEYFRRALAVNSGYARAYLGLADCYAILGTFGFAPPGRVYPKAKAAAIAALEIDPHLPEAYASLATLSALYDWDRKVATARFGEAIDMEPGYAFAHQMYGVSLIGWQRSDEGLAALRTAETLEPTAPMIETQLAAGLYVSGKRAQAEEACQTALELEPNFWPAHYFQALIREEEGRYEEAMQDLAKAIEQSAGNPQTIGSLAHVYASAGERGEASRLLHELENRQSRGGYVPPFVTALVQIGLLNKDAAFEALDKAYHEHSPYLVPRCRSQRIGFQLFRNARKGHTTFANLRNEVLGLWLTTDPRLEFLRSDQRFSELVARTGLLAG